MPVRKARAVWNNDLKNGNGEMSFGSGAYKGSYSFQSRFKEGEGTNPEELIGAAHAGCFSMALSGDLAKAGYNPISIDTSANVKLENVDGNWAITDVELDVEAAVDDIEENTFREIAEAAVKNCPVSKALSGINIELNTTLQ